MKVVVPLLLAMHLATSHAQVVYTWTDEQGVVHFSDVPPEGVKEVEEREMQVPPPLQRGVEATEPSQKGEEPATNEGETRQTEAAPTGGTEQQAERFEGPARVIVTARDLISSGPRSRHVMGAVKNVGGETADDVSMKLHIIAQGNPCDEQEISVAPTTLDPGETGNVDATIESPCFLDQATVDFEPRWR